MKWFKSMKSNKRSLNIWQRCQKQLTKTPFFSCAIPIPIPRISVHSYDNDDLLEDDDDVFAPSSGMILNDDKENLLDPSYSLKRLCRARRRSPPSLSCQRFPSLSLGVSPDQALCVNSPGRRRLQKSSLDSIQDIRYLGKGSFGAVILGKWRGDLFSPYFSKFLGFN